MSSELFGIDDHIQSCLAIIHPIVAKYTLPLFAADLQDRPDLFASCIILKVSDVVYLVTAAHALYEIEKTGSSVHLGGTLIKEIKYNDIRSSVDGKDPLDLAVISLDKKFIEDNKIKPLEVDRTTYKRVFDSPHMHCIHGFPCTKNKKNKAIDFNKKVFKTYGFTYAGSQPISLNYKQFKKDPNIHCTINYSVGKNDTGNRVDPPKGKGMSGGGIWVVPNSFKPENVFLKGILIEQHKETIFATKIDKVLEFIKNNV